jgi:SAM-dependent methyltransferase
MELNNDSLLFNIINKYSLNTDDNDEIVINFYNKDSEWTEQEFNNFINVMRSSKYTENITNEILEVSSNYDDLLCINGINNIIKYCVSDNIPYKHSEWYKKKLIMSDNVNDILDANLTFSLYNKKKSVLPDRWDDISKKYVINKNITYMMRENGVVFVANMRKDKDNSEFYTLKQSGVLKEKQRYNFHISIKKSVFKDGDNVVLNSIIKVIQALYLSPIILSKPQQKTILDEYYKLIKNDVEISPYNKKSGDIPLITPKPITLEKQNLIDPKEYGAISILQGYTLTEKADGERLLMYVNDVGNVYIINNTYKVEDTGIKVAKTGYNSIIDGEYIACNKRKDNANKGLYAAFDMYYMNGKSLMSLPLIEQELKTKESRYEYMKAFAKLVNLKDAEIEFIVKEHIVSDNILKDCNDILYGNKRYPYEIDGLIFTPAKLALYSYYANKPVKVTDNVKWDRVFKWKPVEQNTIDFLIRVNKTISIDGLKYKEVKLFVGYNSSQWEDIDIFHGLRLRYDKEYNNKNRQNLHSYIPVLFKPTIYYSSGVDSSYIKENIRGEIRAENGDKIESDSIVEFKYINDVNIPVSQRWIPLRVRDDKTRIYKKGILSKTANELGVALNIWRSIHNPVTTAMITGNENVYNKEASDNAIERLLETDDVYYSRNIPRESLLSINMLNFHNQGIKKFLYDKPAKKGSLLELACGEAGDLNRWLDSGYTFILGIDLVKKNIYNPKSGAYSRMLKRRYQYLRNIDKNAYYPDMAFAAGDCSLPFKNGEASLAIQDNDSAKLLKIVMNKQKSVENHTKYIAGKGADGFDAISTMFAIHYFFESEDKLDGFLKNVSDNLKKNGVFFCTFMNGDKVEKEIKDNNGDFIEGRKLVTNISSGMPVWAIVRRYDIANDDKYGRKIDVYIENTQRLIPEYLVSFNTLIERANLQGLVLAESEMFEESFNKLKSKIPENVEDKSHLDQDIELLDKDNIQKQFSFLNQWAIFKKV